MVNSSIVNWSNVTTFTDILSVPNQQTGSWFWTLILYGIFIIMLILFSGFGFEVTLLVSASIALIFGVLLAYSGLVAWGWVLTFLGAILFTIVYIVWSSPKRA